MAEASAPSRAEFETLKDEVSALRDALREQKEEMTSARPAPPAASQDAELKVLIGCYAEEIHGYANMVEESMAPLVASLNKLETRLAALHQKLPAVARRARPTPSYDYEDQPTNQQVVRRGRAALAPSAVCTTGAANPQPPGSLGKVLQSQIAEYPAVMDLQPAAAADAMPPRVALRQVAEATEPVEEAVVAAAVDEAEAAGIAAAEAAKVAASAAAAAAAAEAVAAAAAAAAPLPAFPGLSASEEEEGRRFRVLQPHALAREEEEGRRASRTPRTSPPARTSPLGEARQRTSPPRTPRDSAFPTRDAQPFSLPAAPGLSPVPPSRSPLGGMPLWESAADRSPPGRAGTSPGRGRGSFGELPQAGAAELAGTLPGTPSQGAPVHASVYSGQVGSATQPAACAGASHPRQGASPRTALLYPAPGRQICVQRRPQTTQPGSRASMAPPLLQAGNGAVRTLSPTARPVTSSGGRVAPPGAAGNAGAWLPLAPSVAESQDRLADFLGGKAALISPRRGVAGAGSTTAAGSHLPPRPAGGGSGRPRCAGSTGAVTNSAGY